MRVSSVLLPLAAVAIWFVVGRAPSSSAAPAAADAKGVAALAFLEGSWRGTDGESTWEACYSSADAGEVVSATKEIKGGKVVTFDYERFWEQGEKVIFTPYPRGQKSLDFPLVKSEPAARRAVFENAANDFPRTFTYERPADDRLKITLEGANDGHPMKIVIELKKR